jgi:ferric-dicitrate binding protein FerR (iron transport regulator)
MSKLLIGAFILLQTVISVRPGFVDLVDGKSAVQKYEHLAAGKTIQTGPQNRIEIGLGLDSLLRLDENSALVLESVDKADVSVRIEAGRAVVEVPKIEKPNRIHVASGNIRTLIDSKGVFYFSKDTVSVFDGKLQIEGGSLIVQKGSKITYSGGEQRESKLDLSTPQPFKSFLNSPKAGFVNAVQGQANVRASDMAREDQSIKTSASSFLEILLAPGAFLRLDENSEVKIDSAGLNDVVVQVVSGDALIEDIASEPRLPIRVIVGGAKLLISTSGLYRFTPDTASIINGALRLGSKDEETAGSATLVRVTNKEYVTEDLPAETEPGALDLWSAQRSDLLARANFMADYAEPYANFFLYANPSPHLSAWIYSPSVNGFTFVPRLKRESHYGSSFVPLYVLMPNIPMSPGPRVPTPAPPAATGKPAQKGVMRN